MSKSFRKYSTRLVKQFLIKKLHFGGLCDSFIRPKGKHGTFIRPLCYPSVLTVRQGYISGEPVKYQVEIYMPYSGLQSLRALFVNFQTSIMLLLNFSVENEIQPALNPKYVLIFLINTALLHIHGLYSPSHSFSKPNKPISYIL